MATELVRGKTTRILVLNPNSSKAMTEGLKNVIDSMDLPYVCRHSLILTTRNPYIISYRSSKYEAVSDE